MRKKQNKKQLILLSQAAKRTPYSAEYLSLLARKGKIESVKQGNAWFTTKKAIKDYIETIQDTASSAFEKEPCKESKKIAETVNGYVSIAQASEKIPEYSQDYLSLRVRQ